MTNRIGDRIGELTAGTPKHEHRDPDRKAGWNLKTIHCLGVALFRSAFPQGFASLCGSIGEVPVRKIGCQLPPQREVKLSAGKAFYRRRALKCIEEQVSECCAQVGDLCKDGGQGLYRRPLPAIYDFLFIRGE